MENNILGMIAGFMPSGPSLAPADVETLGSGVSTPVDNSSAGGKPDKTKWRDVHMICFSKDRAFQLDQLLESATKHLLLADNDQASGAQVTLRISVLFLISVPPQATAATKVAPVVNIGNSSNRTVRSNACHERNVSASQVKIPFRSMEESYNLVRRRHPSVNFIREEPGKFCHQLLELVASCDKTSHQGDVERFVLFAVDDMFFYQDFGLPGALRLLSSDTSVFCVHLRLHPGITWSYTAGSPSNVPPLSHIGREIASWGKNTGELGVRSSAPRTTAHDPPTADSSHRSRMNRGWPAVVADFSLLTFARREGTGEWDYPWDLTGGLYRREDAAAVLRGVVGAYGKKAAANPNILEHHGHCLLSKARRQVHSQHSGNAGTSSPCLLPSPAPGGPTILASTTANAAVENERSCYATASESRAQPLIESVDRNPPSSATTAAIAAATAVEAARVSPRCACSGRAVVSSLAVNRVQSTYSTPVYNSPGNGILDLDRRLWFRAVMTARDVDGEHEDKDADQGWDSKAKILSECTALKERGTRLDADAYRRRTFASVHVGQIFFEGTMGKTCADGIELGVGEDFTQQHGYGTDAAWPLPATIARHDAPRVKACESGGHRRIDARSGSAGSRHAPRACSDGSSPPASDKSSYIDARSRQPFVTVLLPVKNGGARFVDAVQSVFACVQRAPFNWEVELLIVDDGSDDGAVEEALAVVGLLDNSLWRVDEGLGDAFGKGKEKKKQEAKDPIGSGKSFVELAAADVTTAFPSGITASVASAAACNKADAVDEGAADSRIDGVHKPPTGGARLVARVIRHARTLGLANSLNEGVQEARSELVARMDADDVCIPGRLRAQAEFMYDNPSVSALGSAVATFSGECVCSRQRQMNDETPEHKRHAQHNEQQQQMKAPHLPAARVQRIVRHPTDRAFLSWSLLFGCCLAHPSVMLRRDRVIDAGGYDPGTEPAEDYDLWLRMNGSSPGCLANAGEVLLGLRKHDRNVSRARREEQRKAALTAAALAMSRLLNRDVTETQAAAARTPESAINADDLVEGSRLLCDLEAAVLERNFRRLGNPLEIQGVADEEDRDAFVESDADNQRLWSREMIMRDAEARLGALAVCAIKSFGSEAAPVIDAWSERYPDRPLLRVLGGMV